MYPSFSSYSLCSIFPCSPFSPSVLLIQNDIFSLYHSVFHHILLLFCALPGSPCLCYVEINYNILIIIIMRTVVNFKEIYHALFLKLYVHKILG